MQPRLNWYKREDMWYLWGHKKYLVNFMIGKHKAMRPGEKVCVAYSGGGASTSLLHLLKVSIYLKFEGIKRSFLGCALQEAPVKKSSQEKSSLF